MATPHPPLYTAQNFKAVLDTYSSRELLDVLADLLEELRRRQRTGGEL